MTGRLPLPPPLFTPHASCSVCGPQQPRVQPHRGWKTFSCDFHIRLHGKLEVGNHQLWSDRHCLMRAAMLSVAEDSRFKFFGPPWLLLWCALTVKMQRGTLGHGLDVNDPVPSFAMSSRLFRPGGPNLNFYLQVTGLGLLSSSNHCPPQPPPQRTAIGLPAVCGQHQQRLNGNCLATP